MPVTIYPGTLKKRNSDGTYSDLVPAVNTGGSAGSDNNIADDYRPTTTYAMGDHVLYSGVLYRCISASGATGTWDSTKWDAVTVGEEIENIEGIIDDLESDLLSNFAANYNASASYTIGKYCIHDGQLYRCIVAIPSPGEAWNSSHWATTNISNQVYNTIIKISNQYNPARTYKKDEVCIYGDALKYCKIDMTGPEAWNFSHWGTVTGVMDVVGSGQLDSSFTADNLTGAANELKNTLDHKADVIYDSASGPIASFPDGADGLPAKDLTVGIEPVQDTSGGDPSPTHICPISGWTGANVTRTGFNLWDEEWEVGWLDGSTGLPTVEEGSIRSKNYNSCVGGAEYFVSSTYTIYLYWYDSNKNYIRRDSRENAAVTAPTNAYYFKLGKYHNGITYNHDISINYPSTDHDYHPGTDNTTLPISWQSEAGTVYGGTLDVTSGVLTVTDANIASYNGETLPGEWISDRDVYSSGATPTTGAQVVYKLATPQTYQLTPEEVTTLLGQNNIWADCGPSTVEYPCDTKTYVDNEVGNVENTLTQFKTDAFGSINLTGTNNTGSTITTGTFFYNNGTLVRAKTDIQNGSTITIGTNAETVTDGGLNSLKDSLAKIFAPNAIGYVSDLNLSISRQMGTVYQFTFDERSANNPFSYAGGYGFLFVNIDSTNYGIQIVISNKGIKCRSLFGGSFSTTWQTIVSIS